MKYNFKYRFENGLKSLEIRVKNTGLKWLKLTFSTVAVPLWIRQLCRKENTPCLSVPLGTKLKIGAVG
jgi:hypothetical protein